MDILNAFEDWKKQNLPEQYKKEQLEKLWNELLKEKMEYESYESQQAGIKRLNAIIASLNETIKIMEDLINSEPRTFDEDIWESLAKKSVNLAMKDGIKESE